MDDRHTDDRTQALDLPGAGDVDAGDGAGVPGAGARRGPRQAAEGVRIIGAEEAAAAIQAGQVAGRRPEDAPRFGDVPEPPSGPRPSLRFPGADPQAVEKPPVVEPPARPPAPPPPAAATAGRPYPGPAGAGPALDGPWPGERMTGDGRLPPGPEGEGRYAGPAMATGGDDRSAPPPTDDEFWDDAAPDPPGGGARFGAFGGAEDSGSMPLPHWTEPPSGEVPRILPAGEAPGANDDDLRAWSSLSTGPRWRDQHTDWEEADFGEEMLDDPDTRLGALRAGTASEDEDDLLSFPDPPARRPARAATAAPPAATPAPGGPRRRPAPPSRPAARRSRATPASSSGSGGASRDLTTSVLTGVVALAVVLLAAAIGPRALVVLVTAVLVVASAELFQAMRTRGLHPATLLGVGGTAGLSGAVYWRGIDGFHLALPLFMVFTLLWYLTGVHSGKPVVNAGATLLGFFYVGILGSYAALLLTAPFNDGIGLLLGAVILTAGYDAGAYLIGRSFGNTPLMPDVSPGKTVEGMVGACVVTAILAVAVVAQIHPWTLKRALALAVVVIVAAPLGDLCESMLKRDLGVKDMGSILPAHGGMLDRIDALLFVVPATYYLMRVLKFT
ncbi:MAG: phosphatidate cytidylyltransferase [Acidimicrobiales bacterium]